MNESSTPRLSGWDGKLVLAGMFIVGYYSLILTMVLRPLPATNAGLVRDALLTLGPPIGIIFGALFRTTGAEERNAAMRSSELTTAITTPATTINAEPLKTALVDSFTDALSGAEPVSVRPVAPLQPRAADGRSRDWLDDIQPLGPGPSTSSAPPPGAVGSTPVMED